MKIRLLEEVRVHDTLSLAEGFEYEVQGFQIFTTTGDMTFVLPSECEVLEREVTDAKMARLEFVVSAYEELICKWATDVKRLRCEVIDEPED